MFINLHLGLPRTATTTLQNRVFPEYIGVDYHGKSDVKEINQSFLRTRLLSSWKSFISGEPYQKSLDAWIGELMVCDSPNILISDEALMHWKSPRHPEASEYVTLRNRKVDTPRSGPHPIVEFLKIISDRLPNGWELRAILTLRNQADFLGSLYAQTQGSIYSQKGNPGLDFLENALTTRDASLGFYGIVKSIQDMVGNQNLCLLFYEDGLKYNSQRIIDFIGAEELREPSWEKSQLNAKRIGEGIWKTSPQWPRAVVSAALMLKQFRLGRLLMRTVVSIAPGLKRLVTRRRRTITLSEEQRSRIKSHFSNDTRKLSDLIGRDLYELGY